MKNTMKYLKHLLVGGALLSFGLYGVAQAAVIYDGANTTGVTTDDQYIIDYDDTSTGNITLDFGSAGTKYLRYDTVNDKFQFSNNVDLQSNQLIDARTQNVSSTADIPACAAAGDAGKVIFITSTFVNTLPAQTLTVDNYYVCNTAGNLWLGIPTGFSASDFLSAVHSDTYTGGGPGDNTLTFGSVGNAVNINFDPANATVDLRNTIADSFNLNSNAADGDTTTLTFGDGSGVFTYDDTANAFTFNHDVDFGGNQAINFREENVAALPTCDGTAVGRAVFLTTGITGEYICDGTNWIRSSIDGTTGTLEFSPEYKDGTVRPDGSANVGTMTSDYDSTNARNFYRWTTNNAALQDIDVVLDVRLPDDFKSFAASNALQYDIRASDTTGTNANIDVSGKDTTGTAMTISGTVTDQAVTTANTWQTNSHNVTGGTYTAGSRVQLTLQLADRKVTGVSRTFDLGNLRLNYIKKGQ